MSMSKGTNGLLYRNGFLSFMRQSEIPTQDHPKYGHEYSCTCEVHLITSNVEIRPRPDSLILGFPTVCVNGSRLSRHDGHEVITPPLNTSLGTQANQIPLPFFPSAHMFSTRGRFLPWAGGEVAAIAEQSPLPRHKTTAPLTTYITNTWDPPCVGRLSVCL